MYDYADDDKLLGRLNRVLRRVGLPEVGSDFRSILQLGRQRVREEQAGLLDAKHWEF